MQDWRTWRFGVAGMVLAGLVSAQSATFTPTEDAALLREHPELNFASSELSVEWEKYSIGNAVRRSLLRFELTGVEGLSFDCLTLKLTATALGGGTTYFEVRQVTSPWSETEANWNDQPGLGGVIGNWTRHIASGEVVYIPLDPGALRSSGMFDIALVGHTYGGTSPVEFFSREGSAPPELILGCNGVVQRAGFAVRHPEGPAPLTIQFENFSGGDATSWAWDFGDGASSTLRDPTHVYSLEGRYTVSLTVAGPLGSDTHVRESYIFAHPPDTPLGEVITCSKISQISGGSTPMLEDQDMFGRSVASLGDLDGDGVRDLIVGTVGDDDAPTESGADPPGTIDDNRGFNPGAVHILFMNPDGTVRTFQKISNLYGGLQTLLEDIDGFGRYVAGIGDLDGDGIVDAAVGATRDDDGGIDQGAIYILFLNRDGTVRAESKISATAGGFTAALDPDDQIGRGITSLGDLDGDGIQDLATGATGDDDGGLDRGAVYILFMNRDGTVQSHTKISAMQTQWTGFWFGMDVDCLGDVDGDGVVDLAVGVLLEQSVPAASGAVFVLLMNPDGTVKGESFINAFNGLLAGELEADDEFGGAVAGIGDLDGDAIPDLAVGSIRDDDNLKGEREITDDFGAAYILFLNSDGSVREYQKLSETRGGLDTTFDKYVRFCEGLGAAGDFDGDGWVDLWAGSRFDRDGGPNNGAIYLLRLRGGTVAAPGADFSAGPGAGPLPLTVGFFDRSSGPVTAWMWDFGDGATSNQKNPVHEYGVAGTYTVSLSVSAVSGSDGLTRTDLVVVSPPEPPGAFFSLDPDSGPMPLTVSFSDQSTGAVSAWSWDFGDGGTSGAADPTHTFAQNGTYAVELVVSGPTGSDTRRVEAAVTVGMPAAPTAAFSGTPLSGDAPLQVAFVDATGGNVSAWSWDFGDGTHAGLQNPSHVYARPGTYDVSLSATGLGGSDTISAADFVTVGGEVPAGLSDGGFENQVAGLSPLSPWVVLAGGGHRVGPIGAARDGGMPSEGSKWLEVSAAGSFDATPPGVPGSLTTPSVGASGVAQVFRLPPDNKLVAFDAEFLLGGPEASSSFNDWMSVDISDGVRTLNLFYADSFTPLPELSVEHGLPMSKTAHVAVDLIHAFPTATEETIFTLSVHLGNGGDGAAPSIGRVDGFRLEPFDPDIRRLGCGFNPIGSLLVLQGSPLLGSSMRYGIDNPLGTQNAGAIPVFLVSVSPDLNHPCGTTFSGIGMGGGPGELLIGLLSADILGVFGGSAWGGVGAPSVIDIPLPNLPSITGLTVYVQGFLYDGTPGATVRMGMSDGLEMTLSLLPPSGLANLSRNQPAVQSSDLGGFATAERAVDGSIDGDFAGDSVSHTENELEPYWEVDLESVRTIEWIDLWNRTDCCSRRLEGAFVFVSDVPFVSTVTGEVEAQPDVFSRQLTTCTDTLNRVEVGRTGRYVRIQQTGIGYLQLAEVEVIGYTMPGAVRSAGLEAQYFDEMDLTALKLVRTDPQIELDYESDAPVPELQPGSFSVRWRGFLRPASSELYTFFAETSDGVRLWVDGQLIIDDWFDRLVDESSGTILLDGGKAVPIVMEYYKNTGAALARLSWATDTIGKAIVPAGRLTHWNP